MRMEEVFYNISVYLYNKNVLGYAQIARIGPKSMIGDIEGLSNIHSVWNDLYPNPASPISAYVVVVPPPNIFLLNLRRHLRLWFDLVWKSGFVIWWVVFSSKRRTVSEILLKENHIYF